MRKFTTENTEGFTTEQLDTLNSALKILVNDHGYDADNASDKLNNC